MTGDPQKTRLAGDDPIQLREQAEWFAKSLGES